MIVYTKTVCPKCALVKTMLDHAGVAYETINLDFDSNAEELLKAEGFSSLPVVNYNDKFYIGNDIQELIGELS